MELLKRDDLRVREVAVFQAVLDWASSKCKTNEEALQKAREFLSVIRFSAISSRDMVTHVFPTKIFSLEEQMKILSEKVLQNDKLTKIRRFNEYDSQIKRNISYQTLLDDGWQVLYQYPFSHSTTSEELKKLLSSVISDDSLICCIGKKTGSDDIILCAFGKAKEVLKPNGTKNSAIRYGNVCWYNVDKESFGFAESENIRFGLCIVFNVV